MEPVPDEATQAQGDFGRRRPGAERPAYGPSQSADERYLGYFYDVPPEFVTPERPAFSSGSGYAGACLGLGLSWVYGQWRWSLLGAYLNLAGTPCTGSSLLDSEHDFSVGVTLSWMFWRSERKVTSKNTSPGGELDTQLLGL